MSWPAACASGPCLAPAGHAAIDQARVARRHDVGAEAQPLHHARAEALDQRVGVGEQIEHLRDRRLRCLQVELDHRAAAPGDRLRSLLARRTVERTTSAPMSASIMPANGPGPMPANSTMRLPVSGPDVRGEGCMADLASTAFSIATDFMGSPASLLRDLMVGPSAKLSRLGGRGENLLAASDLDAEAARIGCATL